MLMRRDPFREMMSLQRALDRLMDTSLGEQENWSGNTWGLALDVIEEEDHYLVKASVPGIQPEDLDITFTNGALTIRGEVKDEREDERGEYHLRERRFGSFARTISLPTAIESDKIAAEYKDGVLTLTLPKTEEVKPRRIAVKTGNGQGVLEGKVR